MALPDSAGFLSRLMLTSLGREVMDGEALEHLALRQEAAASIIAAEAAAESELAPLDAALATAELEIRKIGQKLVAAQERRGDLIQQRTRIVERRRVQVQNASRLLRGTAPEELTNFLRCARWCALPRRPDSDLDAGLLGAFLPRAGRVLQKAEALVFQPNVDVKTRIAALRRELDIPPAIARRWEEHERLDGRLAA